MHGSNRFNIQHIAAGVQARKRNPSSYQGVLQFVRSNWPWYLLALFSASASAAILFLCPAPLWLEIACATAIAATLYLTFASLIAAHWIHDRSPLHQWSWLRGCFDVLPRSWAQVYRGSEESSTKLLAMFPPDKVHVLNILDRAMLSDGALMRANRMNGSQPADWLDSPALPVQNASLDAAFLLLSAHQLGLEKHRAAIFQEIKRGLKPGGRLVISAQLRDKMNLLAFGPGAFQFLSKSEVMKRADDEGFKLVKEFSITPFVTVLVLEA